MMILFAAGNRLKLDVLAPGTAILLARLKNKKYLANVHLVGLSEDENYMYLAGTSMATPLVAGCCAVLRQALEAIGYREAPGSPTGSLVKALLINGAVPVGGQYMPDSLGDGYNPHSGFGRVDMVAPLPRPNDPCSGFGTGIVSEDDNAPFAVAIDIPAQGQETKNRNDGFRWALKVTLVISLEVVSSMI